MRLPIWFASAAASVLLGVSAGHAAVLFTGPGSMAERATDTSFDVTFNSDQAGLANLTFVLDGFGSLDGMNFYEDDFTLSLNGHAILSGSWNLGGGGADDLFFAADGATADNVSGNGMGVTWAGGRVNIATPLDLAAGQNTLTFAYGSVVAGHSGFQNMPDEGWATHDVVVTRSVGSDPVGVVPEPASWALMLIGMGGAGAMLRRRKGLLPAFAWASRSR